MSLWASEQKGLLSSMLGWGDVARRHLHRDAATHIATRPSKARSTVVSASLRCRGRRHGAYQATGSAGRQPEWQRPPPPPWARARPRSPTRSRHRCWLSQLPVEQGHVQVVGVASAAASGQRGPAVVARADRCLGRALASHARSTYKSERARNDVDTQTLRALLHSLAQDVHSRLPRRARGPGAALGASGAGGGASAQQGLRCRGEL